MEDSATCRIENTRAAEGVTGDKVPQADLQRRCGWLEEWGAFGEILDFRSDPLGTGCDLFVQPIQSPFLPGVRDYLLQATGVSAR